MRGPMTFLAASRARHSKITWACVPRSKYEVTPARSERLDMPLSLKERVDEAGGTLEMARGMGVTKVSIALPIGGRRR